MNKRLQMLEQMVASGQADAFASYALGMEYRRSGELDKALQVFDQLRVEHGQYLPTYLMAAQILLEQQRAGDAVPWLEQGILVAKQQSDGKALGELQAALEEATN
jgi:tetratricopeptide (TPR) repeat protein